MPEKKIVVIIPARMAASRFPGKPLKKILALPMIEHVRRRVSLCDFIADVYVATCDEEIREVVESYGGKVIMTAATHERATDRVEEAASTLDADIIVNVQGDEPLILPEAIYDVAQPLQERDDVLCTCLIYHIHNLDELNDTNVIKTVLNQNNGIMYFSRSPIPYAGINQDPPLHEQSGIMAFKKEFLHQFSQLKPTPLERTESVDMLRVLEHGYQILGVITSYVTKGVNTPEDIEKMEKALTGDEKQKMLYEKIMAF